MKINYWILICLIKHFQFKLFLLCIMPWFSWSLSIPIQQNIMEFFLTEECPPNTIVGNLKNLPFTKSFDLTHHFQLLTQTSHFYLNETSGLIYTRGRIDRETLCPMKSLFNNPTHHDLIGNSNTEVFESQTNLNLNMPNTNCEIKLQVLDLINDIKSMTKDKTLIVNKVKQVKSSFEQHKVILIKIYILDINDNAPSWQENIIQLNIPEHTIIGKIGRAHV